MVKDIQQERDERYMRRCLQLARCGRQASRPNPMVGAVVVAGEGTAAERIIGEGYHVRCGEAHAEVNAIRSIRPSDLALLPQATVYVSLEPCAHYGKTPPCAELLVKSGVRRVVVGCEDSFAKVSGRGIAMLREAGIEVKVGVLEEQCRRLNRRFFTFHQLQRPYIILKWAQSGDAFTDRKGSAAAISSRFTQRLVHRLRSEEDAIAVGHTTDLREQPRLDVRLWSGRSPRRFVISRDFTPRQLLDACRDEQLQSVIIEGGAATLAWFLNEDLWDELRVETNPALQLGSGTPSPSLPASAKLRSSVAVDGRIINHYIKV